MLICLKGSLAALRICSISLHTWREILVRGVVMRQNAARVFITGRGLVARIASPWAVAKCLAK